MDDGTEAELFENVESQGTKPLESRPVVRGPRLKAINRDQLVLRPTNIEELVARDHEVRAIWEITGRLDLSAYYESIEAVEGVAGREAFDPRLLVSLWVYATKDGVSSAREIRRLCEYHPAYQWLTGMQPINHHTLSDFRVKYGEALNGLFVDILGVLSAEGLVSLERVMHDGTKVKACAGKDSFRQEERLKKHLALAQEQVAAMGDPRSAAEVSPRVAAAQARAAREKEQRLALALTELEKIRAVKDGEQAKEQARASQTDPEARMMKQGNGGYSPSYNVQISTDAQAGAIVGVGTSQAGSDYGELEAAVERVEENLDKPKQVVADGGFTSRSNIMAMEARGIDFIGSLQDPTAARDRRGIDPAFGPDAFVYDPASNTYQCPAGKVLCFQEKRERPGRSEFRYSAPVQDCRGCVFKAKCCPENETRGRGIIRGVEHPAVVAFRQKMEREESKAIYKQRAGIAEFPNAWIKEKLGLREFRCRGLSKVSMEALWACLTYNIQLWIRLRWRPQWQVVAVAG